MNRGKIVLCCAREPYGGAGTGFKMRLYSLRLRAPFETLAVVRTPIAHARFVVSRVR